MDAYAIKGLLGLVGYCRLWVRYTTNDRGPRHTAASGGSRVCITSHLKPNVGRMFCIFPPESRQSEDTNSTKKRKSYQCGLMIACRVTAFRYNLDVFCNLRGGLSLLECIFGCDLSSALNNHEYDINNIRIIIFF